MDLSFFNTLGRRKEIFIPIKPKPGPIGIYSCGPTVYLFPHIGNLRAYVFADLLHRTLEWNGYQIKHVINITDVGHLTSNADQGEDKIEKEARAEGKTAKEITDFYAQAFFADIEKLNIKTEDIIFPRATEHLAEQIDLVKKLEAKGYTYRTSDGIYFDTAKSANYVELARLDLEGLAEGARVEKNPEKKHPTDFALWKFSPTETKRQQEWDSPWGVGFPGWHLECSAMAIKYLGCHFDIHTGGIDHISVHHTNEIAQSEAVCREKFVNYWLHVGHVLIDGEKMSKSLGNIFRLDDLVGKGFDPLAYRYFLLQAGYGQTINFTWEALSGAQIAYHDLLIKTASVAFRAEAKTGGFFFRRATGGSILPAWQEKFTAVINDNLNTSASLAVLWELLNSKEKPADLLVTILDFDRVLGLNLTRARQLIEIPLTIKELVVQREVARTQTDWAAADKFRQMINDQGFDIEDTDTGPFVHKKLS